MGVVQDGRRAPSQSFFDNGNCLHLEGLLLDVDVSDSLFLTQVGRELDFGIYCQTNLYAQIIDKINFLLNLNFCTVICVQHSPQPLMAMWQQGRRVGKYHYHWELAACTAV